jgi:hypothetical protein
LGKEIMSIYNFSPSHNLNFCDTYATWNNGFTDDELDKLIKICEMRNPSKATINSRDADSDFSEIISNGYVPVNVRNKSMPKDHDLAKNPYCLPDTSSGDLNLKSP